MEVNKGYIQIPEGWNALPLKEISFIKGRIGWQGLKHSEFTMNFDEPFLITGMNFKDGEIRWDEVYHVSNERYQIAKEIQLKVNDVLMTKDGTIGKLLFVDYIPYPYKATLNSHLLVFRPIKNNYVPKYLYYQLASKLFMNHIELYKSGSTFFGISQEAVGKYRVLLPTIKEQTAIATALSDADALIQSLEKLIAKKRAIKQGTMQELLRAKEGWVEMRLGEIAEIRSGGTPSTNVPHFWNGDIAWCTPTDITALNGKKYLTNTTRKISEQGLKYSSAEMIPVNSIIMTTRATIGECAINTIPVSTNQGFKNLIPQEGINTEFLYYMLLTKKNKLLSLCSGSTFLEISKVQLTNFPLSIINSYSEQTRIASILSEMDSELMTLEKKLTKYKQIKQGMMQNLLTGRIRLI